MQLIPTKYEANYGGYNYVFTSYKGKWFVHRWSETASFIPPYTQILTADDGWIALLAAPPRARLEFDCLEKIVQFVERGVDIES